MHTEKNSIALSALYRPHRPGAVKSPSFHLEPRVRAVHPGQEFCKHHTRQQHLDARSGIVHDHDRADGTNEQHQNDDPPQNEKVQRGLAALFVAQYFVNGLPGTCRPSILRQTQQGDGSSAVHLAVPVILLDEGLGLHRFRGIAGVAELLPRVGVVPVLWSLVRDLHEVWGSSFATTGVANSDPSGRLGGITIAITCRRPSVARRLAREDPSIDRNAPPPIVLHQTAEGALDVVLQVEGREDNGNAADVGGEDGGGQSDRVGGGGGAIVVGARCWCHCSQSVRRLLACF